MPLISQVFYQKSEYYHRDDNDYGHGPHGGHRAGYGRNTAYDHNTPVF